MAQVKHTLSSNESPVNGSPRLMKRRKMHTPLLFEGNKVNRKCLFGSPEEEEHDSNEMNGHFRKCSDENPFYSEERKALFKKGDKFSPSPNFTFNTPSTGFPTTGGKKGRFSRKDSVLSVDSVETRRMDEQMSFDDGSPKSVRDGNSDSPLGLCFKLDRTCSLNTHACSSDDDGEELLGEDGNSDEDSVTGHRRGERMTHAKTPQPQRRKNPSAKILRRKTVGDLHNKRAEKTFSRFKEEFEELGILGGGSFGTVYRCKNRLDGCLYAVKVTKQQFRGKADKERVLKEVYALAALCNAEENPHIVRYFGAFVEDGRLFIQTELCDMSLQDMIRKKDYPGGLQTVAQEMVRQVLDGLVRLHKQNLVHLDIKPGNIFVKNGTYKVGDLGHACLARRIPTNTTDDCEDHHDTQESLPPPPPLPSTPKKQTKILKIHQLSDKKIHKKQQESMLLNPCVVWGDIEEGDSRYMATEILNEDYSNIQKGDIFSLGASLYEMCLGKELPANGPEWHDIRNGKLNIPALSMYSEHLQQLIQLMLSKDVYRRPSAEALLASGGPGGVLRTEYENRLAREKAAADDYRQQLAKIKSTGGKPPAQFNAFRRSHTM